MSTIPHPSVVLFVAKVQRVAAFYKAIGAMTTVTGDEDHEVLEIAGFQLVVHQLRGEPDPIHDAQGHLRVREDSYVKLCVPVQSIEAARTLAPSLGGFIKATQHEWQARGFRACDGNDPEGNVIQVRASAEPT